MSLFLQKIQLLQFKNYEDAGFEFVDGINCIIGNNGRGKTNLLDAIHYLCFSKGFLNPVDSQNIMHSAPYFMIEGVFQRQGREEVINCAMKRGQKKQFKRNKKEYERLSDHIGLFPLVVISPLDAELVTGGSEFRRKFLDSMVSQTDHDYLDDLIAYNRVLQQRNAFLKQLAERKSVDEETLEVYDAQLVRYGGTIHKKRHSFISEFTVVFNRYYRFIAGDVEQAGLQYHSQLTDSSFEELLQQRRRKDISMEFTTGGVHRDDLMFSLNDHPIKRFGSQGQQKSFLVALKLAEHEYLSGKTNMSPILLLDDIYDKLDAARVSQLVLKVSEKEFGQVFITDTGEEKLSSIFSKFGVHAAFTQV